MAKKRKGIVKPQIEETKRIPRPVVNQSTIHEYPTISFQHLCDKNGQLHELTKRDLKHLSNFLRRVSVMTWSQIRLSDGIKTKKIPITSLRYTLPNSVSEEEEILEMRVSQEHRLWGFQNQSTFYVIWFDPNHSVCPV
ncbi:MAG6450 family protein [Bacillus cereus]|uniref:Uncharacterized protein n=1 Tax=Bacillus cereus (strain VD146) TaxID=1053236 RepID=R8NJH9_BACCX|nr:hypothetical protein [Bacillus cereus]EOP46686.1 hypothetical protein IK1_06095 [Bacillus cereus VD146]